MWENFFAHVDIDPANVHIPRGDIPENEIEAHCHDYERAIERAGGIDIQLLGIGRTGHIGFNEPGSGRDSRTRLVYLDTVTRRDAAADFFGEDNVPLKAITMGVATILDAREVILMATGEHKARILRRAIEGSIPTLRRPTSRSTPTRRSTSTCRRPPSSPASRPHGCSARSPGRASLRSRRWCG
jgi:glucosamine-6-phosphate deaminase